MDVLNPNRLLNSAEHLRGSPLEWPVRELYPHPSYQRHQLSVPAAKLSAISALGDRAFREPLLITTRGEIIDGYARWELARLQQLLTLPCVTCDLSESEALFLLLEHHRRSSTLNAFNRILLALDLEPALKEQALSNQRAGGEKKGLSKLTEAEKVDVRSAIASAAGVSAGNVSKVRDICRVSHPDIQAALRAGEISIHRAWLWSVEALERQREALLSHRSKRGVRKVIQTLISQHRRKLLPEGVGFDDLLARLSAIPSKQRECVSVSVVDKPGRALVLTAELFQTLK